MYCTVENYVLHKVTKHYCIQYTVHCTMYRSYTHMLEMRWRRVATPAEVQSVWQEKDFVFVLCNQRTHRINKLTL